MERGGGGGGGGRLISLIMREAVLEILEEMYFYMISEKYDFTKRYAS